MYRESWTINKTECWRIDAFELWCWRRLLTVPWTARRSNQSILKEINPEYSLEGLMLRLKFRYFGYLMRRVDSLEKALMLGKIKGRRRRDNRGWPSWTQRTWVWAISRRWWTTGKPGALQSTGSQTVGHGRAAELKVAAGDQPASRPFSFCPHHLVLHSLSLCSKIPKTGDLFTFSIMFTTSSTIGCWLIYIWIGWAKSHACSCST